MRFRTQFDPNYKGSKGEITSQKSITVPDMSLTIRELVYNHTRGISTDVHQPAPQYFDMEFPRINDLTDLQAFREAVLEKEAQTIELQQKTQLEQEKRAQEAYERKLREQHEKETDAKRLNFDPPK